MRLSWNEIRTRAANFAREWDGEGYEKGQTQLFYRDFFEVFGVPVRRVASFEEPVKNLGDKRGFIDLFWKGVLLIEQKSLGRDLKKAKTQALNYFPGLKDSELPRFILLSDFQSFELYDLEEDEELHISLADLPKHIEKFGFVIGVERRKFKDQGRTVRYSLAGYVRRRAFDPLRAPHLSVEQRGTRQGGRSLRDRRNDLQEIFAMRDLRVRPCARRASRSKGCSH